MATAIGLLYYHLSQNIVRSDIFVCTYRMYSYMGFRCTVFWEITEPEILRHSSSEAIRPHTFLIAVSIVNPFYCLYFSVLIPLFHLIFCSLTLNVCS